MSDHTTSPLVRHLGLIVTVGVAGAGRAAEETPAAPRGPLVAYAWSSEADHPHIVPMYWVIGPRDAHDPTKAQAATDAMPDGHRVLFLWDFARGIDAHPEDCCRDRDGNLTVTPGIWWDQGANAAARRIDDWFARYKEAGGRVDTVILDYEANVSNWALGDNAARHTAIMEDSRFGPIAAELGFRDLNLVVNWRSGNSYQKWNALMDRRQADYLNRGVFEPIRRHFPHARMSNFGYHSNATPHVCPDRNGYEHSQFGSGALVGTHQSPAIYGWLGNVRHWRVQPDGLNLYGNGPEYGATPFAAFRLSVNQVRSAQLSSTVPLMPWVSHKRFVESRIRDSDLYQELILHTGLSGSDALLLWNPRQQSRNQNADHFTNANQDQLLSDCLGELNDVVGEGPRETLVKNLAGWGDDYVLTGLRCGERSVWRFTPIVPEGTSVETTIVHESPATFRTARGELSIPGSSIDREERSVSAGGIWVVAPGDARPVWNGQLATD